MDKPAAGLEADFIRKNKDKPFIFYYSMHHVPGSIQKTPDTAKDDANLYEDNIRFFRRQVGAVNAELEKLGLREKTPVSIYANAVVTFIHGLP